MNIIYSYTKLQLIITLILFVFQLSCEQTNIWIDYNEIDVVRTQEIQPFTLMENCLMVS